MIEVLASTGDRAEAPDPEAAVVAARTLVRDHLDALRVQGRGRGLTVSFYVNGKHVRTLEGRSL